MAPPRVLVTGFGPFPGAPQNPSAWLAGALSEPAPGLDCELQSEVLPTEWEAVAALTPGLYEALQPHVMIHFGLSLKALSWRIERSAHNRVLPRADACGALPSTGVVYAGAPDRLDSRLPAAALAANLRSLGIAAAASHSCGRYLCNFLYFRSLAWAARQERPPLVLFVHVPPAPALGQAALVDAARETLRFTLEYAGNCAVPGIPVHSPHQFAEATLQAGEVP